VRKSEELGEVALLKLAKGSIEASLGRLLHCELCEISGRTRRRQ
jgi:hypothetical protein